MTIPSDEQGQWSSETIPKFWVWARFSDCFSDCTSSHKKLPQKQYLDEGSIPVIDQGEAILGGYTDNTALKYDGKLPVIIWGDHTRCIKFINYEFVQGADGVKVLLPRNGIEPKYAYYALREIKLPDKGYSRHFKFLKSSHFPIPPLNEQRRIVAKLDRLFARSRCAREELGRVSGLVQRYKQAILAAACSGRLTADWREENENILSKTSNQNDWSSEKFNSVAEFKNGINFTKEQKGNKGISTIDVLNMYSKGIYVDLDGLYKVDIDIKEDYILRYGDVLFVRSSVKKEGVGWVSLFPKIDDVVTFCGFIIRARVNLSKVYPEFLTYFFRTDASRRMLVDGSRQVTIANINQATLSEIELLLPPLEEQKEIVQRVEKLFKAIDLIEQEHQKASKLLDRLEQATLSKAFRGELVPQDPNDEPAAVLLERIQAEQQAQTKGKAIKSKQSHR